MSYNNYRKKYKYDQDYRPNFGRDYGYNYKDNYESSYLDDYTTSAISYEESIKRSRPTSPHSKSEYGHQRHNNRESYRRKSPIADYEDYFKQDDSVKKRSKQIKNDIQNVFYQFEIESDKFKKTERKSRSPRRRDYYDDPFFERPEDNYEYDKYFEKTKPKEKRPKKNVNEDIAAEDRNKKNKQKYYSKKENDYHVFSYKEPKLHEKVFKSRAKNREKSPPSSEIEIKTTDYPILAFKDKNVSQNTSKTSSVFYLPTVYCQDNKSKSQGKTKHRVQSSPPGDTQVFAANIDEKNNIFTQEENKKNSTNQAGSKVQTEESLVSRNRQLQKDSNARTSTETQTDESLIFENKFPSTQSYKHSGSILGSIFEKAKLKDNNSSRETKGINKYVSTIKNKNLFAYQIDIDIEPDKKNVFGSRISKLDPTDKTRQIEYKQIEDPLHDDYPVTKDYIKVSDISSIQTKANTISSITRPSETSAGTLTDLKGNLKHNKYVLKDNHSGSRKYNRVINFTDKMTNEGSRDASRVNELVIKDIPENCITRSAEYNRGSENNRTSVLNPTNFEFDKTTDYSRKTIQPHDIQVFRSAVNNAFKKSITQRPSIGLQEKQSTRKSIPKEPSPIKLSQVNDEKSILSVNTNRQSGEVQNKSGQQIFTGQEEEEEEPDTQKERKSVVKQRDAPLVVDTSETSLRASRVEMPNRDSPLNGRKSQSTIRESRLDGSNRDSSSVGRQKQSAIRESKVDRTNRDSPIVDKKSQSDIRESIVSRTIRDSPLVDRKSQSVIRESGVGRPRDSSLVNTKSQPITRESRMEELNYTANINEDNENNKKNTNTFKNSQIAKHKEKKESKSILRTPSLFKKTSRVKEKDLKPLYSKNNNFQEENIIVIDNLEPKDGRKSSLRDSGEHKTEKSEIRPSRKPEIRDTNSKTRFPELISMSKSKIESDDELETPRKSVRQSFASKSGEYTSGERKSGVIPSSKSKTKDTTSKKTFSRLFLRSKSRTGKEKSADETQSKSKVPSKTKLSSADENTALAKQTPSQATLSQKKSKQQKITKRALSQSQLQDNGTSQVKKAKSKSKIWGFLKRSSSKNVPETSSTVHEPSISQHQEPELKPPSETPGEISSQAEVKPRKKQESVSRHKKENVPKEEKPCECVTQYVKQARDCGNFFLGPTLHEQIMDILKVV